MKERVLETINFYERKRAYQEKRVEEKRETLARVLVKYDKGEIGYEKVERADRDLAMYHDFLNTTTNILKDLNYILKGDE